MTVKLEVFEPSEDIYYLQKQIENLLKDYRFRFGAGYKIHYSTSTGSGGDNQGAVSYSA